MVGCGLLPGRYDALHRPSKSIWLWPLRYGWTQISMVSTAAVRVTNVLCSLMIYFHFSLLNLSCLLNYFGRVSGLRVNGCKSVAMNINLSLLLVSHLFCWWSYFVPYLDICLSPSLVSLYKMNYPPLYKKLEEDLQEWTNHGLSWLGSIYSVKIFVVTPYVILLSIPTQIDYSVRPSLVPIQVSKVYLG